MAFYGISGQRVNSDLKKLTNVLLFVFFILNRKLSVENSIVAVKQVVVVKKPIIPNSTTNFFFANFTLSSYRPIKNAQFPIDSLFCLEQKATAVLDIQEKKKAGSLEKTNLRSEIC